MMDEVTLKACYSGESDELTKLRKEVERLSKLCDKWNSECDEYREENKKVCGQLATAQLDNKELRDVLQVYWDQGISETFYYKVKQLLPLEPFNDSALRSYVAWEMRKMVEGSHRSATFSPFIIRCYADRYERGEV